MPMTDPPSDPNEASGAASACVSTLEAGTSPTVDARTRLEAVEQRFSLLVSSVTDYAIFMLDERGHVASWNAGAERIKGYRADEIVGKPIETFYTAEARRSGRPRALLSQAVADGRVEDQDWRVRKDGSLFWADVVITALRAETGALCGFAKVVRDLTERRAAEERLRQSEERFRLLVEQVEDYAIFMLDPDGRVATWNAGAEKIKGYRADEVLGKHFSIFYDPVDVRRGKCELELTSAARDGRYEDEGWRIRKDGQRMWVNAVLTALHGPSGELLGFSKVTRDLSERKRAEEERARLVRTEEAVRLRDAFLAIASHELKTPLTALQLQLDGLVKRTAALDTGISERVARALRNCMRLNDLIESLLDVSRIATDQLTLRLEPLDLSELAGQVVERLQELAAKAGCVLTLESAGPALVRADALRLEQAISNVLDNSIKYGRGRPIEVTLGCDADEATLTVRDHGPGIAEADRKRIFDRFERASPVRHYGGLGVGLYVARQIIDAHGGVITADDAAGGGACLRFRLPLAHDAAETP